MTDSPTFHFLSEISKKNTYSLLFPDAKTGLAIICLYEKIEQGLFPGGIFKESDIHDALMQVSAVNLNNGQYHLKEQYNTIVSRLQEYFLRYDDETQQYSFKEYAYAFCKHAKDTLKAFFDPTEIEVICVNLRDKLSQCKTDAKVLEWFSFEFTTFQPRLKNQLDYLDKQIDQSVADLRENRKLSLQEGAIIETLREIDERFEVIRTQNKELRTAFRVTNEIKRLLDRYATQYDNDDIHRHTYDAGSFFGEMHHVLLLIDKRLDRIQPRVKQLFSNLNKPLFNIRVEKFIGYLIRNAYEVNMQGKKILSFPNGIPEIITHIEVPKFTIVERRADLFPAKPKKRIVVTEDPIRKQQAFAATINRFFQQDDVAKWLNVISEQLLREEAIELSDYFFDILETEKEHVNPLGLAISVLYRAMKDYEQQPSYKVMIDPDCIKRKEGFKTTLWKIAIQKK